MVIELKNAACETATLADAFHQLQTYRQQIPALFRTNALLIISDGLLARVGSLSAEEGRFMPWRTVTGARDDFTVFGDRGDGVSRSLPATTSSTARVIDAADVNTPAVFGEYVDIYHISRAVEDEATVPIYYESCLARVELQTEKLPEIDAAVDALFDDETLSEQEKAKSSWSSVECLVGAPPRLEKVAQDIVEHFEARLQALAGKGIFVCMSRAICVALHERIVARRPDWHSEDDSQGAVKIVMTGSASDPPEWQPHIGGKMRRDLLAKRARDPEDPLRLVIVRDMWLTGFDAPAMHTMYIDKPMRGHGLMQAIARVKRVFRDKPGGLVVDYIGIGQNLKKALQNYTANGREQTGIDEEAAVAALKERVERARHFFSGFDYQSGLTGPARKRLQVLAGAIEWVLQKQKERADAAPDEKAKKAARNHYVDLVVALSKAFALAAASDYAQKVK